MKTNIKIRSDKIVTSYAKKTPCKNRKEMDKNLNKKLSEMKNMYDF